MKRVSFSLTLAAIFTGALATIVFAQQMGSSGASTTLGQAEALLQDGKPQEAREVLAQIGQNDADYAAARCYDLLCLHALKDYRGVVSNFNSTVVASAAVSTEVRERLNFSQVDALYQLKQHEAVLPVAKSFIEGHPASARSAIVREYRMASLLEFGLKQTVHASQLKEEQKFQQKWASARSKLEEFLGLAQSYPATNYLNLEKRSLRDDIWTARLTLGQEREVLEEAKKGDPATLERASLLRVQLYQKLRPEDVDRNLQIMGDFLRQYPESKAVKRIQFDAAGLSYQRGKELILAADVADAGGDAAAAREKRNQARQHFETMRGLQAVTVEDEEAGIGAPDVRDLQEDLLCSYALEKNYNTVLSLASEMITGSELSELKWIMGKEYYGIVLANQDPPQTAQAIAIFDELLKLGFTGKPENDRLMATVARWRVTLALRQSDLEGARKVIRQVQDGPCAKNFKKEFLNDYAVYVSAANPTEAK
jgi:hypothetical protein